MAEKKKHLIKVQDQLVPVNEEVYLTYYRMKRREIYLEERDTANGVFITVHWMPRELMERM